MGSRMARRLLDGGWPLSVYDVRPEAAATAVAAGAQAGASPRAATRGAAFAVVLVRDHAQAEQALAGPDGALAGLGPGATVVLMSTLAPKQARDLEQIAAARGVALLDAPMSGGTP